MARDLNTSNSSIIRRILSIPSIPMYSNVCLPAQELDQVAHCLTYDILQDNIRDKLVIILITYLDVVNLDI